MSDNDTISRSHFDDRVRRIVSVDKELSADYLDGVDMVLYLLSTEPTVPQEMTAREYLMVRTRMCYKYESCEGCPLNIINEKYNCAEARARAMRRERPKGEWIRLGMHKGEEQFKCSVCKVECYVPECMYEPIYAYCPNCGADMRSNHG